IHCLMVCRMLVDLNLPLSSEEEDITLASALCHDMIEDIPFPKKGRELVDVFGLDKRIYEIVKLLSKRKDFTEEEEKAHFHAIESNRLALLVKLSDRSHNVEDLYNMSQWKVHEYIGETEKFFHPMCDYGTQHYPEVVQVLEILRNKILSLTQVSEVLVDRLALREKELQDERDALKRENEELRAELSAVWR
ncbi:MAG: HD domain-containing protein, partial [Spirochaetales bacterium]|nr:HD domain-containing protein [Candidatus Physcosoma equi]